MIKVCVANALLSRAAVFAVSIVCALSALVSPVATAGEALPLEIKPLAEKTVAELPSGELFWRIENFETLSQAKSAAGAWSLAVECRDRVWLFTLGPAGGASPGGTKVADVGPIAWVAAKEYLLRINQASGPQGSITPVHTHPGSEAFLVLAGEQSIRSPHGTMRVAAGETEAGHGADMAMQVSSSGRDDLLALVMFVVDASKPFSPPATFPENAAH